MSDDDHIPEFLVNSSNSLVAALFLFVPGCTISYNAPVLPLMASSQADLRQYATVMQEVAR